MITMVTINNPLFTYRIHGNKILQFHCDGLEQTFSINGDSTYFYSQESKKKEIDCKLSDTVWRRQSVFY